MPVSEFTGFGPTPPRDHGGGWVKTAAGVGAWTALALAAREWYDQRRQPEYVNGRKTYDEDAVAMLFSCWDTLEQMRPYLMTAGPVETWDGDLAFNVRMCQYLQRFFPEEFEAWRSRNYRVHT